jgi:hypothetical protein
VGVIHAELLGVSMPSDLGSSLPLMMVEVEAGLDVGGSWLEWGVVKANEGVCKWCCLL